MPLAVMPLTCVRCAELLATHPRRMPPANASGEPRRFPGVGSTALLAELYQFFGLLIREFVSVVIFQYML